jgi:hypothetical protein
MTDNISSQHIDLSSWITLYVLIYLYFSVTPDDGSVGPKHVAYTRYCYIKNTAERLLLKTTRRSRSFVFTIHDNKQFEV